MPPSHKPVRRALLLLPPAPSPSSYASLKAAYNAPLFTVLKELATSCPSRAQGATLLEIALPCPHLYGHVDAPRALHYATTHQLVADLYKLICITASREAIDTEDDQGIDARILLVAYPRNGQLAAPLPDATPEQELQGPVIDMHTLAKSRRVWDAVYSVESEEGEQVLKSFLSSSISHQAVTKVRGGIVSVEASAPEPSTHPTNKKFAEQLESWKERQESVHAFLSSLVYFGPENDERVCIREVQAPGPNGHVVNVDYPFGLTIRYVEIWDPFGPTITDKEISALVLSLETRSGGAAVNKKRAEQGWDPLDVFEVAVLDASEEDKVDERFQSKLSSTEIRRKRSERT
ncbi:hypothetical protein HRS9139_05946 [Pyrenophora teres f. teres]|nr:hypothetical protein HRS9139_05946 [Pyrenophora teres f. teres]